MTWFNEKMHLPDHQYHELMRVREFMKEHVLIAFLISISKMEDALQNVPILQGDDGLFITLKFLKEIKFGDKSTITNVKPGLIQYEISKTTMRGLCLNQMLTLHLLKVQRKC